MKSSWGVASRALSSERLDQALMRPPFSLSRRGAKRAMEEGSVIVEGVSIAVASRNVAPGARIALIDSAASLPLLELGADFVIIDKPPVLPAQIPADTDAVSAPELLAAQLRRNGERRAVKIVHRLDTNTTGAMALALGDAAAARLAGKLQSRASQKIYLALVQGAVSEEQLIDAPIARTGAREFGVRPDGRAARSIIRPLQHTSDVSLVEGELLTGRTHQLRIHFSHAGHPILGDRKYGGAVAEDAPRPMLHAWKLSIEGEGSWTAPVPDDMKRVMERSGIAWNE